MNVDIKHCNLLFLAVKGWPSLLFPSPTTTSSSGLLEASSCLALSAPIAPKQVGSQALRLAKNFYEHHVHGLLFSWLDLYLPLVIM